MQPNHQQMSFHFWNCQLTEASPKYSWDPENGDGAHRNGTDERPQRRPGRQGEGEGEGAANGDATSKEKVPVAENGHKNGTSNGESNGKHNGEESDEGEENGEAATDADYMQHVLKVNACILGPKATGVHLISVRTKCYQSEPGNCPIVCIDPDSQRTLTLTYEFVLDSQNEVIFELTEGTGPVWLTGLHQVRVHEDADDGVVGDGEAEGEEDSLVSGEDENDAIDETSRFRLAHVVEEEAEDEEEEEMEEEGEGDSDRDGECNTGCIGENKQKQVLGIRSPITTAQLRRRKRLRLGDADDEGDGEANADTVTDEVAAK